MAEHQMFASKDLKRRPFRTTLTLISLTSVVNEMSVRVVLNGRLLRSLDANI
jgi:hypothetical protein